MHILANLDYWLERYQTLAAAFLAIAGVYYSVVPVRRQLTMLERQWNAQRKLALLETYKMLAKAMNLLDPEAWRSQVRYAERPSEEDLAGEAIRPALAEAYRQRKELWRNLRNRLREELNAEQAAAVESLLVKGDGRFAECDESLEANARAKRDEAIGDGATTEHWWFSAKYPDHMIPGIMQDARAALADLAGQTVEALGSTEI